MRGFLGGFFALGALFFMLGALIADEDSKPLGSDPAALFDQLDKNHDGQITKDEVPQDKQRLFERLLRSADKDKNGSLSREEFIAGLKEGRPARQPERNRPDGPGAKEGQPDPEEMFKRLDANGDGKITADEVPEERRAMFDRLLAKGDKNGDGALSKEEFVDALRAIRGEFGGGAPGGAGGRPEPAQIFKHLDKNGDGKITADEVPEERREMFEKLLATGDKDGDKALSREEFLEAFRALGNRGGDGPAGNGRPEGRGRQSDMFKRWDKNGDGKVTLDEVPEQRRKLFQKMLKRADKNGDKALSEEEFNEAIRSGVLGDGASPNGVGPTKEILADVGPLARRPDGLAVCSAAPDTDGDGVLSEAEIAAAPAVLRKLDKNGDGKLTHEEVMGGSPPPPPRDRERDGDSSRLERRGGPSDGPAAERGPPRGGRDFIVTALERRFNEIDTNGDGVIDRREFMRHAQQMMGRMERFAQDGPPRRFDDDGDNGHDRRPPPRDRRGPGERGGPPDGGGPPPRDFDEE